MRAPLCRTPWQVTTFAPEPPAAAHKEAYLCTRRLLKSCDFPAGAANVYFALRLSSRTFRTCAEHTTNLCAANRCNAQRQGLFTLQRRYRESQIPHEPANAHEHLSHRVFFLEAMQVSGDSHPYNEYVPSLACPENGGGGAVSVGFPLGHYQNGYLQQEADMHKHPHKQPWPLFTSDLSLFPPADLSALGFSQAAPGCGGADR